MTANHNVSKILLVVGFVLTMLLPVASADSASDISANTSRLTNGIVGSLADNVPAAIGLAVIVLIVALAFSVFQGMKWH